MPNAPTTSSAATSSDIGARQMFHVTINGSIDDVWREITRTDSVIPCFFNMRMHLPEGTRIGGPLRMRSGNGKITGVVGEIVEWNPPRRFAHTFKFTQFDDPPCTVIYELRETGNGVEFTLTLENVPVGTKTAKQMVQGSQWIVDTLKATIEGKPIPFMMRFVHVMGALTAPFSPKRCSSERWP
ncbi:MAG: SRPBCC domain-containing protein [Phycisphaerae bacterium]|nr:SRPBCC domain-containing protein [Phycisphaerae bacterium]